ncbi:hypothetical protein LOTGIDRAFT_161309 [Lottia gigantea]|uniref:NIDO domain-containing protein n=1 Tax=Lottia gigantea TaxID=225164 RepID=V4AHD9_LOTGI|nr:hypothetical protein LOTGIDRAFT_161309 [Lottia gigantea]ESO94605.1 hypothetical protein LOTGIDRAFT_161309 [Lottia gigantea]
MSVITTMKMLFIIGIVYEWKQSNAQTYLPFGLSEGDIQPPVDAQFAQINLTESFKLYGNLYSKLYINIDGIISFNSELRVTQIQGAFPIGDGITVICVLCADVKVANGGEVWYGMRSDTTTLNKVGDDVKTYFENLNPSWVFVGTWNNVKSFANDESEGTGNVFQVILASDSEMSIVIFHYFNITWVYDSKPFPDVSIQVRAKSGFNAGDGVSYYIHPDSKTEEMVNIDEDSNYNELGMFMYKVDAIIEQPTLVSSTIVISTAPTTPITSTESVSSSASSEASSGPTMSLTSTDNIPSSLSSQTNTVSHNDLTTSSSPVVSTLSPDQSGLPGYLTVIFALLGSVCGLLIIAGVVYFFCFKKIHQSLPKPTKIQVMNNNVLSDSSEERKYEEPFKIPRPKISHNKIHVV